MESEDRSPPSRCFPVDTVVLETEQFTGTGVALLREGIYPPRNELAGGLPLLVATPAPCEQRSPACKPAAAIAR